MSQWQNRRIAITGAGGFIGSHLVERLVNEGAQVRALVRYNSSNSHGNIEKLPEALRERVEVVLGDVTSQTSMDRLVEGQEIVFHLAALVAIPYSYLDPSSYVNVNVRGTLNVLEACRRQNIQRLIHTSTSEVYGTAQRVPIDESHPLQAQSPYSASKISADKLVESYACSFDMPVVTLRPFNTFGPRQSARAIIPTIMTQALTSGHVKLGNTTPTRDLIYVSDTVEGFLRAATAVDAPGKTIHLGTGREISMGSLVELIGTLLGKTLTIEQDNERVRPPGSEVERLLADATLARNVLGWSSSISLEDGLKTTLTWMQEHLYSYKQGAYVV